MKVDYVESTAIETIDTWILQLRIEELEMNYFQVASNNAFEHVNTGHCAVCAHWLSDMNACDRHLRLENGALSMIW